MDKIMNSTNKNSSMIENVPSSSGLPFGQNSLVTENDLGFVPSSSGLQLGRSSSMLESQLNPLAIESETISVNEIMQLLTDDEANSKSDYNDNKFDEQDGNDDEHPNMKMRNYRHTKQHIEEMEALFKECPKPNKKKMKELSNKLELEPLQIKFWFQNRRTQIKNQGQHSENLSLRAENDKLRTECVWLSEAINNGCPNCGDHGLCLGETPNNEQYLRLENARLQEEVVHISRQLYISNVIRAAMYELLQMAQMDEPLWLPNIDGVKNVFNEEEFKRKFPRGNEPKPNGIKTTASRESALVTMNHINLVEIFMDTNHWASFFSSIVLTARTMDVLDGSTKMIYAVFQVPSPQIPNRDCYFVRSCNKIVDGLWVIVDVSLDHTPITRCWKRPSGCVIQQISNDISKVTWVEHIDADDTLIHTFYKTFVNSSLAFGAKRWISVLDRQCERLASAEATNLPQNNITHTLSIDKERRKSVLKLGERMIIDYISGVSGTTTHQWTTFTGSGYNINDLQVMTRQSINDPGRPRGLVLCASTSIWLPVLPKLVFDFLRNENTRGKWDVLSNGGTIQQVTHIANGTEIGNSISILRVNSPNPAENNMLIVQESITDPTGSFIVYAPIDDIRAIDMVLCGGNPDGVPLLPSGFAIFPDGPSGSTNYEISDYSGSFLTIAFQILVHSVPTANISPQSVAAVNKLIFCTIDKIKDALFLNF